MRYYRQIFDILCSETKICLIRLLSLLNMINSLLTNSRLSLFLHNEQFLTMLDLILMLLFLKFCNFMIIQGNKNLHYLTSDGLTYLRVEMMMQTCEWRYADYGQFIVKSATDKYRLFVANYSGNAGNNYQNGFDVFFPRLRMRHVQFCQLCHE